MPSKLPLLAVLLLLSALLLAASSGHAATAGSVTVLTAFEEELEAEEEFGLGECIEAEEEFEMGELPEVEVEEICEEAETAGLGKRGGRGAAGQCPLRSVRAHDTVKDMKLKVTVGYTTYEPVKATIQLRKGATRIASYKRRMGKSGVLRFTKKLKEKHLSKRTVVRIKLPGGRSGCSSRRLVLFPR